MPANRAQDERLLSMVKARSNGLSLTEVASRFGSSSGPVTKQTNKVMNADLEASTTEPTKTVKAAYWPRKE